MDERRVVTDLHRQFTELLKQEGKRKQIALAIDRYATKLVQSGEVEALSESVQEIIFGCLDLHHWGDSSLPPTYNLKKVEGLVKHLDKLERSNRRSRTL